MKHISHPQFKFITLKNWIHLENDSKQKSRIVRSSWFVDNNMYSNYYYYYYYKNSCWNLEENKTYEIYWTDVRVEQLIINKTTLPFYKYCMHDLHLYLCSAHVVWVLQLQWCNESHKIIQHFKFLFILPIVSKRVSSILCLRTILLLRKEDENNN